MLKRLWQRLFPKRVERRRHEQLLALHRKAQRRRDAVRSGRERLTT